MLGVTINTNKAPNNAAEEAYYTDGLRRFISVDLADAVNWRRLLPFVDPDFSAIDHIDVNAIGIERGPKRHMIHAHFVVTIQHHGKVRLNRYLEGHWQRFVTEKVRYTKGAYVHIQLLNSKHLNYVSKQSGTSKQLRQLGVQEAVVF